MVMSKQHNTGLITLFNGRSFSADTKLVI